MATALKNLSEYDKTTVCDGKNKRIGIVVSEWNTEITGALLEGAYEALLQHGVEKERIEIKQVPGSYELVMGANLMLRKTHFDAIICLGCVIQGETRHFDFICDAVAHGIIQTELKYDIPVIFGVLTTNTFEQAKERSGGKHGNKGVEAAITALKMADF